MYISSQPTDTELTSSISASGDRSIRVWCIRTGAHLTTFEAAHPRGIASLDFLPAPQSRSIPKEDGTVIKGYIVSGSSDATVRLSTLVTVPFGTSQEGLVDPMEGLSFREMMSGNQDVDMFSPASAPAPAGENDITTTASVVRILEGPVCWTDCLCPPALRKPDSTHCMRCWNRGHTALVRSLCLRHNIIISGGYDGTAKVSGILHLYPVSERHRS
jgi:WD40 repeat protein